jgi:hypothetical protein
MNATNIFIKFNNCFLSFYSFTKIGCYKPTPLKWISPSRFRQIGKETWKFYLQLFFSFSSSFFLGMVTPLHLTHYDPLVLGNSLRRLYDLERVLLIGEIFTSIQILHRYLLFRHTQTLLQLRDMKHVVHIRQLWWQLQLIGHSTSLLRNIEQSTEHRCELSSYLEMAQTSHRWHLEVHKISNFKIQLPSRMIGIALPSWLL